MSPWLFTPLGLIHLPPVWALEMRAALSTCRRWGHSGWPAGFFQRLGWGSPAGSVGKNLPAHAGDVGSISGLGGSPREVSGKSHGQRSLAGTVHGVLMSRTCWCFRRWRSVQGDHAILAGVGAPLVSWLSESGPDLRRQHPLGAH